MIERKVKGYSSPTLVFVEITIENFLCVSVPEVDPGGNEDAVWGDDL